ncbi:MAG: helix-turn-helix transcriptional regulator [Aerococcus sp.]|nr:helix-turn-helix transcriptional regulator [Aerococcus sp.]
MTIGQVIEEKLKERGMTANQLAVKSNLYPRTIYQLVNREATNPTLHTAFKIADALGIDVNEFRDK